MFIQGIIGFKKDRLEYKMMCVDQDAEGTYLDFLKFYKNTPRNEIVNFFNKIIWLTEKDCKNPKSVLEKMNFISTYNASNLLRWYVKHSNLERVRKDIIKVHKAVSNVDQYFLDTVYECEEDRVPIKFDISEIDVNFEKRNKELYLKILNDFNLSEEEALYRYIINIDNDTLEVNVKGDNSNVVINRDNVDTIAKPHIQFN